ncbi:MAG TPA: hypothetical protein PK402_10665 [Tepidisphaeraceae bacterium]|nr:hypothetical protein [Tepidisphaeraceae bacterium]
MRAALLIFSILAMVGNVFSTLMGIVLLLAGSPNSSPEQLLFIKRMMLVIAVLGAICLIGAIVLNVNRMLGWSIAVSLVPVVLVIGFFIWAYFSEA